jgi:hypothetical protein
MSGSGADPSADSDVDVIVTTRNDGPGLSNFVSQLPEQGVHELFIVDRGSTEIDAVRVLDRLEADGYHVVRQDHTGISRARNEGARVSRAPFLLYLDVATLPLEGFLGDASTRLHDDAGLAAVLADGQREDGELIVTSASDPAAMVASVQSEPYSLWRRAAIEKVGGWDERLRNAQDRDLFLTLIEAGWSFAKLPSKGFTRLEAHGLVPPPDQLAARADGIRMAEKHRELFTAHLTAVVGAYESALAEAGSARPTGNRGRGDARTVHDLMDQLASVRADLARSEAEGVRAREILADAGAARLEAEHQADEARAVLHQRIAALDREIAAIHATKTQRFLRVPRRVYATARRWIR